MKEGQAMSTYPPGYLARNLDVAKIIGLNAGLCSIVERLKKRKDCPLWLIGKLVDLIYVSNYLITPLVQHRDELKEEHHE